MGIQMDNASSAMKARFVTRNQTIGGKPFNVIQLDPAKISKASIGKEDNKSMDVTKAKENWRFARDSKFLKICMARLRQLSPKIIVSNIPEGKEDLLKKHIIEAGYTIKSMEGSKRSEAPKSGFTMQVIEHLQKKQLVLSLTFIIHGQRRWEPRTKIIFSVSVDLTFPLQED